MKAANSKPKVDHKVQKDKQKQAETADKPVSAIDGARLGRSSHIKRMQGIRRALVDNPREAAIDLLRDQIAANAVIATAQIKQFSRIGFEIVDKAGNINPAILRFWETQKALTGGLQTLLRLEAVNTPPGKPTTGPQPDTESEPLDISSIVLELSSQSNSTK